MGDLDFTLHILRIATLEEIVKVLNNLDKLVKTSNKVSRPDPAKRQQREIEEETKKGETVIRLLPR